MHGRTAGAGHLLPQADTERAGDVAGRHGSRRGAAFYRSGEDCGHLDVQGEVISVLVLYSARGGGSSSVLYSGASAFDVAMKVACAWASSGGGASVRVVTGWPTRVKNSSCPEGAHMHSNRDGLSPRW